MDIHSPPQEVVSDLRRCLAARRVGVFREQAREKIKRAGVLFDNPELTVTLRHGHVYDFRGVKNEKWVWNAHVSETVRKQMEAGSWRMGPHSQTILILGEYFRQEDTGPELMSVHVVSETGTTLVIHHFFYLAGKWSWDLRAKVKQAEKWKFDGVAPEDFEELQLVIQEGLGHLELLRSKREVIVVEPAPFEWVQGAGKPKAFQRPNPSVSIVRVNTPRLIRLAPPEPTGATVRPHDRRGHTRTVGNRKITVRESKIHGGAPFPTAKIVKLDRG